MNKPSNSITRSKQYLFTNDKNTGTFKLTKNFQRWGTCGIIKEKLNNWLKVIQLETYLVRVHGKCDYLISVVNHSAVLVLKQTEPPTAWAWLVWLHPASGIFLSLLSSAQLFAFWCTVSMACLLWAILYRNDRSAESPTFIMVSNLCGSSNFMVHNEQGQQHCWNFSCHALTF